MKVCVVTKGCYSDESIRGVFSSREKADEYAKIYADDPNKAEFNFYEDIELDDPNGEWRKHNGLFPFQVQLHSKSRAKDVGYRWSAVKAGAVAKRMESDPNGSPMRPFFGEPKWHLYLSGENPDDWLVCEVWARDEEHAIKIASDERVRYLTRPEKSRFGVIDMG